MLNKFFRLSACLMITLALSPAKAEIRDGDFPNGVCSEYMRVEACLNHCRPQIENCMKASNNEAYACCRHCMWPSEPFRKLGNQSPWYEKCQN